MWSPDMVSFDLAVHFVERTLVASGSISNGPLMLRKAHEAAVAAAVLAEREACAKVIEDWPTWDVWRSEGAAAIRARYKDGGGHG
jgi:hypothetical protein